MPRLAVLGCGRIGRMHADNIAAHPRTSLAGVFDIDRAAAEAVAGRLGVPAFATADAVFASSDVDAVLIATSTSTHADFIEQAVASGKPVLCEKPIDLDRKRVDDCAARIAGSTTPIMLGFVRRFDPGHRAARQALLDGKIGDLHQVVITSRDPGLASEAYLAGSGGIFRDMTIHDFDLARFMLGEEVEAVFATGSRLVAPDLMTTLGDYDTATVVLVTAGGKQCIITNSRHAAYGYDQRVELFGSRGMAISENRRAYDVAIHGPQFTDLRPPLMHFFIERYHQAFNAEIGAFADVVEKGVAPEVGFEDGRRALLLAEAAFRSVAEQRSVRVSEMG